MDHGLNNAPGLTDCAFDAAVIKLFTEDIKLCFEKTRS
jgi:hypothetical protein